MLGIVYDRMYRFFKEYDEHAEHDFLVQSILVKLITSEEPIQLLLKIEDSRVVGHILMSIEYDMGVPVVAINQAEFDNGVASKTEEDTWMDSVASFGQQHNAQRIALITRRHPRTFEKRYGFKVHRTIMTKDLIPLSVLAVTNGHKE